MSSIKIAAFLLILFCSAGVLAQQEVPKDLRITLERFPCYGNCPFYKLTIYSDGTVVFLPKSIRKDYKKGYKEVAGKIRKGRISQEQLGELISEFEKINFFALEDQYGSTDYKPDKNCPEMWTDHSSAETSITINGKTKTVNHYHGCQGSDLLRNLTQFETRIDVIVNTNQWLVSNKQ